MRVTIVQPRAPFHGEVIRSDDFHVADLIEWTAGLLDAMADSRRAKEELAVLGGKPDAAWAERWLRPGKCKFCPREATCPALDREGGRAAQAAALWFEAPPARGDAEPGEPEHLADLLARFELVEDWIKAKRARAHHLAEGGVEIPGYRLVETNGHRKWLGDVGVTRTALAGLGLGGEDIDDRRLRSPAAVEKVLGAKRKHEIAGLWVKSVTGKTLVRSSSTERPTVQGAAERYFEITED